MAPGAIRDIAKHETIRSSQLGLRQRAACAQAAHSRHLNSSCRAACGSMELPDGQDELLAGLGVTAADVEAVERRVVAENEELQRRRREEAQQRKRKRLPLTCARRDGIGGR